MTIIFLNPQTGNLHICPETSPPIIITPNDAAPHIPNDDLLYVENGHILNKNLFLDWLQNGVNPMGQTPHAQQPTTATSASINANRLYIHPKQNGSVLIGDIKTPRFPEGIQLHGKYHFIGIDEIGQENLDESTHFKLLMAKNKIEIVSEEFVRKNQHKGKSTSKADAALDAIIIKNDRPGSAIAVSSVGGLDTPDSELDEGSIPIYVQ